MEGVDRECPSSAEVAQPDGNRNCGVAREGETLALMPWKEGRKSLMSAMESNNIYIAITDSIPSQASSSVPLFVTFTYLGQSGYSQLYVTVVCIID